MCFCFFTDTATTEIYTLSLHDALPISLRSKSIAASMSIYTDAPPRRSNVESPSVAVEKGGSRAGGWYGACNPYIDRKSTRLNSSHVEISYAVFCLKKKK